MHALDIGTKFHYADGAMAVERIQDCTPIAEHAKALHNAGQHGSSDMKHAASLPFVVVEAYCNQHNIEFSEFMSNREHIKRMLNDPSLSAFRIWPGKV